MSVLTSSEQTERLIVSGQNADGTYFDVEAIQILTLIPVDDVAAYLAAYDGSSSSPDETTAREIARAVLDALVAYSS